MLEDREEWRHLSGVWREAEEIASGRSGSYPFDRAGQKMFLRELASVRRDVDLLGEGGELSRVEASLLKEELGRLLDRVQEMRPIEMRMVTCYMPVDVPMLTQTESDRLRRRLPLLDRLAAEEQLHPDVVYLVLAGVEDDLPGSDGADVCAAVEACLGRIRARVRGGAEDLADTTEWRMIISFWEAAGALAKSGRSTTQQREAVDAALQRAEKAARHLAVAGLLCVAEAELLMAEGRDLQRAVYRNPPTDAKVTCYLMRDVPAAEASAARLTERLPLLEKLARTDRAPREVFDKVIPAIEADLKVLRDEGNLQELDEEARGEVAYALLPQVEEAVRELKARMSRK